MREVTLLGLMNPERHEVNAQIEAKIGTPIGDIPIRSKIFMRVACGAQPGHRVQVLVDAVGQGQAHGGGVFKPGRGAPPAGPGKAAGTGGQRTC